MHKILTGFNKKLSIAFMLILLSASTLSASHVHIDSDLGENSEHCLAYHVVDHIQPLSESDHNFGLQSVGSTYSVSIDAETASRVHLPPARAPPLFS